MNDNVSFHLIMSLTSIGGDLKYDFKSEINRELTHQLYAINRD